MKRVIISSLLCLVIASCASLQVPPIALPTNTAQPTATSVATSTPTLEATATGVLMSDGLIMLSPNHYKFLIWPLSFSLPDAWDINNKLHLSSVDFGRETYTFYRNDAVDIDTRNESPKITVIFETVPDKVDLKTYSEETLAKWQSDFLSDAKIIDSDGLGLDSNTTMAYITHFMFEDVEYTQYIIHAIHQTMAIEIIMNSKTEAFESIESEFVFFLSVLSASTSSAGIRYRPLRNWACA